MTDYAAIAGKARAWLSDVDWDWEGLPELRDELKRLTTTILQPPLSVETELRTFAALRTAAEIFDLLDWGHVEEVADLETDLEVAVAELGVQIEWPGYTGCPRCQIAYDVESYPSCVYPRDVPAISDPCPRCGDIAEGFDRFIEAIFPSCPLHPSTRAADCVVRCRRCNVPHRSHRHDAVHSYAGAFCPQFQPNGRCNHGLWEDENCQVCAAERARQVKFYLGGLHKRVVL